MGVSNRIPKEAIPALAAQYFLGHSVELLVEIADRSRAKGFYTRDDFLVMCRSVRASKSCTANPAGQIETETRICLSTDSEHERIHSLMRLSGVSWSTASVFLHYTFEDQYPMLTQETLWS